ncbi:hypothetical protein Ancab_023546, partial [Ancistrocladus abbreviatus]
MPRHWLVPNYSASAPPYSVVQDWAVCLNYMLGMAQHCRSRPCLPAEKKKLENERKYRVMEIRNRVQLQQMSCNCRDGDEKGLN